MKKFTILFLTLFTVANLFSQTYEIDFAGTGDTTVVDSVRVKNLNRDTSVTVMGDDILQLNVIPPVNAIDNTTSDFGSLQVYPNPMTEQATIKFFVNASGNVRVAVYDLSGKTVGQSTRFLHTGNHTYSIKGLSQGIYLVQVNEQNNTYVAKLVSLNNSKEEVEIVYDGSENITIEQGFYELKKGDVITTAEIAGVQAAKKTYELIPLCHNINLDKISVTGYLTENGVRVESEVKCTGKTGVEMEALTAVSVALLTIYDMCKAVDKEMVISDIQLTEKIKI